MERLICATPAGRTKYMRYLVPQILISDEVEKYEIWLNTRNKYDLDFFEFLEKTFPKVKLIEQPDGIVNGNKSINAFFKKAMDEDAIYVRLDDDIVWLEPDFFSKIKNARLADKESFLLSPLIINNSICTHLLQQEKKFEYPDYLPAYSADTLTWEDPKFAFQIHEWFLDLLEQNQEAKLRLPVDYTIALNRFSINAISWYGKVMKSFDGVVLGDDEEYMTVIKGRELGKTNKILGNVLVSHFAFYTQRALLDSTNLLERYGQAVKKTYADSKEIMEIFKIIDAFLASKDEEIRLNVPPPKTPLQNFIDSTKNTIKNIKVPTIQFETIENIRKNISVANEKK